jgi:cysteine desulfurase
MSRPIIYCDHNANSPVRTEAAEAVVRALELGGNPSSVHGAGRRARALMEGARESIAAAIEARVENLVLTSGATEALHLALDGARGAAKSVVVSAVEHDSVFAQASRSYDDVRIASVNAAGVIDLDALSAVLADAPKPALVAIMLANNETGAIQPIREIAALVREIGGLLLVDAVQALGKMPVSLVDLDANYLVITSHKIGGPMGAGALALGAGAPYAAPHSGGGQERGRRPGAECLPAIVGFAAAAEIANARWAEESAHTQKLRDRFEQALPNSATIFSKDAPRLPNTSLFALDGVRAETALIALDLEGVCASSGAACSSGKVRASRVLGAMGYADAAERGAVRVSFGWSSTDADCDAAIAAVQRLAARAAEAA